MTSKFAMLKVDHV